MARETVVADEISSTFWLTIFESAQEQMVNPNSISAIIKDAHLPPHSFIFLKISQISRSCELHYNTPFGHNWSAVCKNACTDNALNMHSGRASCQKTFRLEIPVRKACCTERPFHMLSFNFIDVSLGIPMFMSSPHS